MSLSEAFALTNTSKVAVLVDEYKQLSSVETPEWVIQQRENLDLPPHMLLEGEVLKSTADGFNPGDTVYVRMNAGLVIGHNDNDIPSLGQFVPEGKTLRIYGRNEDPCEQVLLKKI